MLAIKKRDGLAVTIGLQMVLMPQYADQILSLARLSRELRPDYLVIRHCPDDEDGTPGVDCGAYEAIYDRRREVEALSDDEHKVVVTWSKIRDGHRRSDQRCYSASFMIQLSGAGRLVAPCGMLFIERSRKFRIGNPPRRLSFIGRGRRRPEALGRGSGSRGRAARHARRDVIFPPSRRHG